MQITSETTSEMTEAHSIGSIDAIYRELVATGNDSWPTEDVEIARTLNNGRGFIISEPAPTGEWVEDQLIRIVNAYDGPPTLNSITLAVEKGEWMFRFMLPWVDGVGTGIPHGGMLRIRNPVLVWDVQLYEAPVLTAVRGCDRILPTISMPTCKGEI
jgi:hypothetical protein